jgi:peptidylprolyl isomerase
VIAIILALENGSLILADYTAKVKDTGQVFETTRREEAEKAGIADPTRNYEPRLIAVGDPTWSLVLKGLDEAIQKGEAGQTIDVELPPEKAFGPRDPNKVSRIPLRKFGDKVSELNVGSEVELDNRVGIVRQIESGRAIVDFNHRYAGKTLEYQVSIKEKLEDRNAQITALIRRRMPVEKDKLKFELEGDTFLRIYVPNDLLLWEGLQITKRGISNDLFKFVKTLEKIAFEEDYENPAKKKEEEEVKSEKPAETTVPVSEAQSTVTQTAEEKGGDIERGGGETNSDDEGGGEDSPKKSTRKRTTSPVKKRRRA